jgi:hypothetical protein
VRRERERERISTDTAIRIQQAVDIHGSFTISRTEPRHRRIRSSPSWRRYKRDTKTAHRVPETKR